MAQSIEDINAVRLRLVRVGFTPLPLYGKEPPIYGKNNSKRGFGDWQLLNGVTHEQIEMWGKTWPDAVNTGILTRSTPALDLDILNEEAARAAEDLVREHYEEHGPILVRIGRPPKRALLFRTDEPFEKIVVNLTAPNDSTEKIEFLANGQQIVVDGIHPDTGKAYSWHGGEPGQTACEELPYIRGAEAKELVDKIVDLLVREHGYSRSATRPKAKANGSHHSNAGGQYRGASADWQYLLDNIHAGRELHDSLRDLAAKLTTAGMSEGAAVNLLRAAMDSSVAPRDDRWQDRYDDIPRLVDSASGFREPQQQPQPQSSPHGMEELQGMTFNPIKYVVPGVIVEGLTLFAGRPKFGKSWLLLHAAAAVARGGYTLGDIHCKEGDVLYCALEDNERRLQGRMAKLIGMGQPWPKRMSYYALGEMGRLIDGGMDTIRSWITSVPHPRLVVIDTFTRVRSPKKNNQTNYEADYESGRELQKLANEHGVAIVIVHHTRKAEADDAFDTISGTLGLNGVVDTLLVLKRESSGTIVLHGQGRDLAGLEKALTFNTNACTWAICGDATEVRRTAERRAVLEAVREAGEPVGPKDIADATGMKTQNVKFLLRKLHNEGAIRESELRQVSILPEGSVTGEIDPDVLQ